MPENACCDPLDLPCPGFALMHMEDGPLPEVAAGTLISWPQHRPPPVLPTGVALEVRAGQGVHFFPLDRPWSLYLEHLEPFDLGNLEPVLEAAAAAGCYWVVAAGISPREGGAQDYRYRLYSLIRLLCDRLKLTFSIYETQPLEPAQRLNHYLASQRGCCRGPARLQPKQPAE